MFSARIFNPLGLLISALSLPSILFAAPGLTDSEVSFSSERRATIAEAFQSNPPTTMTFSPHNYWPVLAYDHPLGGGRVNSFNRDGKFFVWNANTLQWYDRTSSNLTGKPGDLPLNFKPVVGYFYPYSNGSGQIQLWTEGGDFWVYCASCKHPTKSWPGRWYNQTHQKDWMGLGSNFLVDSGYYDHSQRKIILRGKTEGPSRYGSVWDRKYFVSTDGMKFSSVPDPFIHSPSTEELEEWAAEIGCFDPDATRYRKGDAPSSLVTATTTGIAEDGSIIRRRDVCLHRKRLREYSCDMNGQIVFWDTSCFDHCDNGRCVDSMTEY